MLKSAVLPICLLSMPLFAQPIEIVRRDSSLEGQAQKALLATQDYVITRAPSAKDEDFEDLYWINLEDSKFDRLSLETFGRVEAFIPDAFAVLKIKSQDLEAAADGLHEDRWVCGQMIRLFGDEVSLTQNRAKTSPVIPIGNTIPELSQIQDSVQIDSLEQTINSMVDLGTRYGKSSKAGQVTDYLGQVYREIAGSRTDITIEKFNHRNYSQPSLIVKIKGTKYPDEIIVLGSHIDSINRTGNGGTAPGADDNASGTASQLEVFRAIINNKLSFERSIEIHGYALEELGLLGSQDIAQNYSQNGKKVVAMLQNDMNLFKASGPDMIWLVTNDVDSQLTSDTEKLVKKYQTIAVGKNRLTAGTSDHRSWTRQGVPTVFPTENPVNYNHRIHTPDDTVDNSGEFSQAIEFSKLTLSFIAHYAGLTSDGEAEKG